MHYSINVIDLLTSCFLDLFKMYVYIVQIVNNSCSVEIAENHMLDK